MTAWPIAYFLTTAPSFQPSSSMFDTHSPLPLLATGVLHRAQVGACGLQDGQGAVQDRACRPGRGECACMCKQHNESWAGAYVLE